MSSDYLVRVERGRASEEEVAALTAVLLARAAGAGSGGRGRGGGHHASSARWRRLERTQGFRAPHSWQR